MTDAAEITVMSAEDGNAFRATLSDHLFRYPRLEVQDLYKLIYQAAMGSEHACQDIVAAHTWLEHELNGLSEGPEEPVVDPLSPDGRIVRVNLRPYRAAGGDQSGLLAAFIRTANEYQGTLTRLRQYWSYAERMARAKELPFSPNCLREVFAKLEAEGFPPVNHSEAYETAYHPAYRVIVREFLFWQSIR